jgi:hypothetical protein
MKALPERGSVRLSKRLAPWCLCAALVGCGGGGEDAPPAMISWNGSANGSTVKDADNDSFSFTADGVLYRDEVQYPGVKVMQAQILWSGAVVGYIGSADAQGGGQIAVVYCSDGSRMNFTFVNAVVTYNCVTASGGGGTAGTSGGSTSPPTHRYVSWTGNDFGESLRDAEGDWYVVHADTRQIGFTGSAADGPQRLDNPVWYPNTRIGTDARIVVDGVAAGAVASGPNPAGLTVFYFRCDDGSQMSMGATNGRATHGCPVGGGAGGGSGAGGGGTGGGSGSSSYSFITITGSDNGVCILDNSNDCFAIDANTRRVSFLGRSGTVNVLDTTQVPANTYGNAQAVYSGGVLDGLALDGRRVATIRYVRLTNGQLGAAFLCDERYYAEIYANPASPGDALFQCSRTLADLD